LLEGPWESAFSVVKLNKPFVKPGPEGRGRIGGGLVISLGQTEEGSEDIKCSVRAPRHLGPKEQTYVTRESHVGGTAGCRLPDSLELVIRERNGFRYLMVL
jgi:hypothetical protein